MTTSGNEYSADEISRMLAQDIDRLAPRWLPQGVQQQNEWCVGDISGKPGTSLKIVTKGAKKGMWVDWSFGQDQKGNDAIDLLKAVKGLSTAQAIEDAKKILGLDVATPQTSPLPEKSSDDRKAEKAEKARRLWADCRAGDGSLVETYLRARGINATPPENLRLHPRLKHWTVGENGDWTTDYVGPAMVAALEQTDGTVTAVQRTWLRPDGKDKASLDATKKTLGAAAGGAVKFGGAGKTLYIAEGVETALSMLFATGAHCWATLGASIMGAVEVTGDYDPIVFCCDGDDDGASKRAALKAEKRLKKAGYTVRVFVAPAGKDINDLLSERKAEDAA